MDYLDLFTKAVEFFKTEKTALGLLIFCGIMYLSREEVKKLKAQFLAALKKFSEAWTEDWTDHEKRISEAEIRLAQMMRIHTERHPDDALEVWDIKREKPRKPKIAAIAMSEEDENDKKQESRS